MMRLTLLIVLLAGIHVAIAKEAISCESITMKLTKKDASCYSQALFLNPSHFEQRNATCILHKVCSSAAKSDTEVTTDSNVESCVRLDTRRGTFEISKQHITTVKQSRNVTWRCPSFIRVPVQKDVLLLRTHGSSKISPYDLLMSGKASSLHMSIEAAKANRTRTFKSPLLESDAYRKSLSKVRVEMRDRNGYVKAYLGFTFRSSDRLTSGQWFSKTRLYTAKPWSYRRMRIQRYNYFSLKGVKDVRATRRFYANLNFGGCGRDKGYFGVVDRAYCSYEKRTKYKPAYIYTHMRSNAWRWASKTYEAAEFRIYGIFRSGAQLYVRRSEDC